MRQVSLLACLSLAGCFIVDVDYENEEVVCTSQSRKGQEKPQACPVGIGSEPFAERGRHVYPDGSPARLEGCNNATWRSVDGSFPSGDYECCYIVRGKVERWFVVCED